MLKAQQRFKGKRHNVFTEETNKVALSWNEDQRMKSIDSVETCEHGARKQEIKWKRITRAIQ